MKTTFIFPPPGKIRPAGQGGRLAPLSAKGYFN
jgi:hypothetical protein